VLRFGVSAAPLEGAEIQMEVGVDFASSGPADKGGARKPLAKSEAGGEDGITMLDLARRPQLFSTFRWPLGDPPGTILFIGSAPADLIAGIAAIPFNTFVYFRGVLKVRIVVNATAFQQGQLIAWFMPDTDVLEAGAQAGNLVSQTMGHHVTIMAGRTSEATLVIPFVLTRDLLLTQASGRGIGSLCVTVFNSLLGGAGLQPPVVVSMFASMEADFQVLDPSSIPRMRLPGLHSSAPLFGAEIQGAVGSVLRKVSNVTGSAASTIDFANKTLVGLDFPALDRPNIGANYTPLTQRPFFEMSNLDGLDYAVSLAETNQERIVDEARVAGGGGTILRELVSRFTFYTTVRWETQAAGALLAEFLMTPTPLAATVAPGTEKVPTLLEFSTLPFAFWRGALKYRIVVVTAGLQTGRLGIVTRYAQPAGAVALDVAFGQYLMVIDLSAGTTVFEFTIPYRSQTQMLSVPYQRVSAPEVLDYAMGYWQIVVLNDLQTNESVAPSVELNIYVAGGDDFEVDYLRELGTRVVVVR